MTTLELLEEKVPDLTQYELLILLERVVHSLKTYSVMPPKQKQINPEEFFGIWKMKNSNSIDEEIKKLRSEWDRNIF